MNKEIFVKSLTIPNEDEKIDFERASQVQKLYWRYGLDPYALTHAKDVYLMTKDISVFDSEELKKHDAVTIGMIETLSWVLDNLVKREVTVFDYLREFAFASSVAEKVANWKSNSD